MRAACGKCGRVYEINDRFAGRAVKMPCRHCGHVTRVEVTAAPAPTPAPDRTADGAEDLPQRPSPTPAPGRRERSGEADAPVGVPTLYPVPRREGAAMASEGGGPAPSESEEASFAELFAPEPTPAPAEAGRQVGQADVLDDLPPIVALSLEPAAPAWPTPPPFAPIEASSTGPEPSRPPPPNMHPAPTPRATPAPQATSAPAAAPATMAARADAAPPAARPVDGWRGWAVPAAMGVVLLAVAGTWYLSGSGEPPSVRRSGPQDGPPLAAEGAASGEARSRAPAPPTVAPAPPAVAPAPPPVTSPAPAERPLAAVPPAGGERPRPLSNPPARPTRPGERRPPEPSAPLWVAAAAPPATPAPPPEEVPGRVAMVPSAPKGPETAPAPTPSTANLPPRTSEQTQATLAQYARSFAGCVAEARQAEPDLVATPRPVVVTMVVRANGRVAYPTLDDAALGESALGGCLKRQASAMVFPEAGGEPVRVRMPLVLGE